MNTKSITITANGNQTVVDWPCSLEEFVQRCGWKPTQVVVEYNGNILPRSELGKSQLNDGDRVEVIVPVAGG